MQIIWKIYRNSISLHSNITHTHCKYMENQAENQKMNLRGYYHSLAEPSFPKKEFIQKVSVACNVDTYTVRNWIAGRVKPANPAHVVILSEISGIPVEELWNA